MTYKPRLHHFARLLMSVAVGLSFTGCGNSSNGGSTGSSFEQVPLINEPHEGLTIKDETSFPWLSLKLFSASKNCKLKFAQPESPWETYSGTWTAIQLPNNTYQIEISDLTAGTGCDCEMTCHDLKLTIPADKLKAYRLGEPISGATLRGSFTHKKSSTPSCQFGLYTGTFDIQKTVTIQQDPSGPV